MKRNYFKIKPTCIIILPDDAVITGHTVIPLPKMPSSFTSSPLSPLSPDYELTPTPTYRAPSPILPKPAPEVSRSPMSTLDRYRNRSRPSRIQTSTDEEKFVLDRAQPERLNKQVRGRIPRKIKRTLCDLTFSMSILNHQKNCFEISISHNCL